MTQQTATPAPAEPRTLAQIHEQERQYAHQLIDAISDMLNGGECISDEQMIAAMHTHPLDILWVRIEDYAWYKAQQGRLRRIAFDDDTSVAIAQHVARYYRRGAIIGPEWERQRAELADTKQRALKVPAVIRRRAQRSRTDRRAQRSRTDR